MNRSTAQNWMTTKGLTQAFALYEASADGFVLQGAFDGCANLVYAYAVGEHQRILRVTHRDDRDEAMLRAELDWVLTLDAANVRVSVPVQSAAGRMIETLDTSVGPLWVVAFERARGMRVPDNGYRYRNDAPLSEYFHNWGSMLGAMHRCARAYAPSPGIAPRPDWFALHGPRRLLRERVPDSADHGEWAAVHRWAEGLLDEIAALPRDPDAYGIVHGDFNDGNFCLDYTNGDITVFDFDDCCQFWFVYELAAAWEAGTGRTMFEPDPAVRRAFMERYIGTLLEGYVSENTLPDVWLARLPLFVKLVHFETFLYHAQDIGENDPEDMAGLAYLRNCFERDLRWMGFYSDLYDAARPWCS